MRLSPRTLAEDDRRRQLDGDGIKRTCRHAWFITRHSHCILNNALRHDPFAGPARPYLTHQPLEFGARPAHLAITSHLSIPSFLLFFSFFVHSPFVGFVFFSLSLCHLRTSSESCIPHPHAPRPSTSILKPRSVSFGSRLSFRYLAFSFLADRLRRIDTTRGFCALFLIHSVDLLHLFATIQLNVSFFSRRPL